MQSMPLYDTVEGKLSTAYKNRQAHIARATRKYTYGMVLRVRLDIIFGQLVD
jgi:hypothetical protein